MSEPPVIPPRGPRRNTGRGLLVVVFGLLCGVSAAALVFRFANATFGLVGLLGLAAVLVGCRMLAGGFTPWMLPAAALGVFPAFLGLAMGAQQLTWERAAVTVTCRVSSVSPVHEQQDGSDSYVHELRCPAAGYTIRTPRLRPEGTRVAVTYSTRGAPRPVFADEVPSDWPIAIGSLGLGIPMLLIGVAGAWQSGRRRDRARARPLIPHEFAPYPLSDPRGLPDETHRHG